MTLISSFNSSIENGPILLIFGTQNPEETSHQQFLNLSTSIEKFEKKHFQK